VDYVNQILNEGMYRRKALIKTGRDRIRPILMTALTTIFALFVMAFDNSAEGSMMQPMAIATIGGMIYATLLTIFFVPIMYDLFNKMRGNIAEVSHSAGVIYTASNEMKPYEQIEKYAGDAPYDKSLLKNISIKSLSTSKLMEIYDVKSQEKMKE
jgi:predicted RND superfamily exporter protein